jgi:hypothetical protein
MLRSFFSSAILAIVLAVAVGAQRVPPPRVMRPGPGIQALERWSRMTPEQRSKALDRLPPERRQKIEKQLDRYQSLTPEQREQLRFRAQMFQQLPPEKQDEARRLFRQFNQLPPDRRGVLREEFRNLRGLSEADRTARVESDEFRSKFDNREQRFLRSLSGLTQ